ncbi:hypothetical protein Trydic_g15268 [Trypoxylus dichotomus]
MPKRNELSLEKRGQIPPLLEQGILQVEISKTVKCYGVIRAIGPEWGANGSRQTGMTERYCEKTSSDLAAELSESFNKTISARIIRRWL